MAYRAAVVGGSGYTGAELLRLLAGHPEIEVVQVTADSNVGRGGRRPVPVAGRRLRRPRLRAARAPPTSPGSTSCSCALPARRSRRRIAADLVDTVGHVVDLGADFRLPAPTTSSGTARRTPRPSCSSRFAFGLPELYRDEIVAARARRRRPAATRPPRRSRWRRCSRAGLVEPTGIVVDAVSGVSGAGRGLKATSLFSEANENVTAYGLLTHRHTAEMEQALAHVAGQPVQVLFTPHLVPTTRGILATCYARPAAGGAFSTDGLLEQLPRLLRRRAVRARRRRARRPPRRRSASNAAHVTVRYDERTDTVLAIGALDNLVKGASGQAIQDANLVLGLPETTGLVRLVRESSP